MPPPHLHGGSGVGMGETETLMDSPESPDALVQMPPRFRDEKVHSARLGSLTMLLCSLPASIIDESLEISSVVSVTWSFDRHWVARLPLEDGPVGQKHPRWKPFCFRICGRSVWQRSTIKEFTIKRFASMWLCKSGRKSELLIACPKNTSY